MSANNCLFLLYIMINVISDYTVYKHCFGGAICQMLFDTFVDSDMIHMNLFQLFVFYCVIFSSSFSTKCDSVSQA